MLPFYCVEGVGCAQVQCHGDASLPRATTAAGSRAWGDVDLTADD